MVSGGHGSSTTYMKTSVFDAVIRSMIGQPVVASFRLLQLRMWEISGSPIINGGLDSGSRYSSSPPQMTSMKYRACGSAGRQVWQMAKVLWGNALHTLLYCIVPKVGSLFPRLRTQVERESWIHTIVIPGVEFIGCRPRAPNKEPACAPVMQSSQELK